MILTQEAYHLENWILAWALKIRFLASLPISTLSQCYREKELRKQFLKTKSTS